MSPLRAGAQGALGLAKEARDALHPDAVAVEALAAAGGLAGVQILDGQPGAVGRLGARQLRPVFFYSRSLREACGLPLLGTVPMLVDEESQRRDRKDLLRFAAACGSLIAAYGAGLLALFLISVRTA